MSLPGKGSFSSIYNILEPLKFPARVYFKLFICIIFVAAIFAKSTLDGLRSIARHANTYFEFKIL